MGYEKFILDVDRLGGYQRMLQGMAVDDNGLAADAYDEVEPGNHFLGCGHTLRNYETAFYDAQMSDSESFEQWEDKGSLDAARRAHVKWKRKLEEYEAPRLDEAVEEELLEFIRHVTNADEDRWY